jgi:hypothetical protein
MGVSFELLPDNRRRYGREASTFSRDEFLLTINFNAKNFFISLLTVQSKDY